MQTEAHNSPWPYSYWLAVALALTIGLATVGSSIFVDWLAHDIVRRIYFSDVLIGSVASLLSGIALVRLQVRRRQLLARMQIIEDVNHHVRNALTAIILSTALKNDPELNALVRDAGERIDWVLSSVLSQAARQNMTAPQRSRWNPGWQLKPSTKKAHRQNEAAGDKVYIDEPKG